MWRKKEKARDIIAFKFNLLLLYELYHKVVRRVKPYAHRIQKLWYEQILNGPKICYSLAHKHKY